MERKKSNVNLVLVILIVSETVGKILVEWSILMLS